MNTNIFVCWVLVEYEYEYWEYSNIRLKSSNIRISLKQIGEKQIYLLSYLILWVSWNYNLAESASNKASKWWKCFICRNIWVIEYSNIVDQLFEYLIIFVIEISNIRIRISSIRLKIFEYSNIFEYSSRTDHESYY